MWVKQGAFTGKLRTVFPQIAIWRSFMDQLGGVDHLYFAISIKLLSGSRT